MLKRLTKDQRLCLALGLTALTLVALALVYGLGGDPVSLARQASGWWDDNRSEFLDWITHHRLQATVLLFAAVSVLPALMLPVSPLLALCGLILGPVWGVLIAGIGMMTNALATYLIARKFRPWVARKVSRWGFTLPKIQRTRLAYLMIPLRVIPGTPFVVQNYLIGLSGAKPADFARWVLILEIPCSAPYVFIGAGLRGGHRYLFIAGAALLMAVFWAHILRAKRAPSPNPNVT